MEFEIDSEPAWEKDRRNGLSLVFDRPEKATPLELGNARSADMSGAQMRIGGEGNPWIELSKESISHYAGGFLTESPTKISWTLKAPQRKVYLAGSLRTEHVTELHAELARLRPELDLFSDWKATHQQSDDAWRDYEKGRGRTYREALRAPAAQNVLQFDRRHIDESDTLVLVYPAGKSAHIELGYAVGAGKRTAVFMTEEPERWDIMLAFADVVFHDVRELAAWL